MSVGEVFRRWREARVEAGICVRCGECRGSGGTTLYCRPCADHNTHRMRATRRRGAAAVKAQISIRHGMAMDLLMGRDPWR